MANNNNGAVLLKLTRFQVVFEVHSPTCTLQRSEVLGNFRIHPNHRAVYSGRAVVSNLISMGGVAVCEAMLDPEWVGEEPVPAGSEEELRVEFNRFLQRWQKNYRVLPEFKVVVADMQSLLADLRLWLDQLELGIRALPATERTAAEREVAQRLGSCTTPALVALFEKFEGAARLVQDDLRPAHVAFCRRQLHPLLLCSPFMHRIYTKPLGYAGDYEMVGMILRDPYEGGSLFARMLNGFILSQAPAIAHRNRVTFLTQRLQEETHRVARKGGRARIFNIGCGPAGEIQAFLEHDALSSHAQFTLLDANDETLKYAGEVLRDLARRNGRQASFQLVKKSVLQLLKRNGKPKGPAQSYDFIYCAGLFDYLNDRICKALMEVLFESLAPGGLLLATNVDAYNPIRNIMEYLFDWHLVYRTGNELAQLAPDGVDADSVKVTADVTSSNIFIDIRKPHAAT